MKKYKQDNYIYKLYLYTLFVNFFLFSLVGSIYGLIIGGIGDLLLLPFYIGFAVCTIFSVYKACSVIYDNTSHRRSSRVIKKNDFLNTGKGLELEDLISLSDQYILYKEQESNPYTKILTSKVVQNARRNNESNLVSLLNDKEDYRDKRQLSRTSQVHGTGSLVCISHADNQAASQSVRSISKTHLAGRLENLLRSQNITSRIESTVPAIPPMPNGNLFANKSEVQLRKNKTHDGSISIPKLSDELLSSIRNFDQESLKKQKYLRQRDDSDKNTTLSGLGVLFNNVLEGRRQANAFSDSEDDSDNYSAASEWEEDVKTSSKTQKGNNDGITKSCVEDDNRHIDSSVDSIEDGTEKVGNNIKEMQKPKSLFRSSSLSNLNNIEEPQKLRNLLYSSSSLNLEDRR